MRSVGIRELRQHASRVLRDVERGETIEVTDRGRPIALLTPVPGADPVERLVASGRLVRGTGHLLDLGPPLPPAAGAPPPSAVLEADRADGR
jgi:prevent-host-death family protein